MKIHQVEQRTPQWFELRKGIPCTSGFKNIITPKGVPTTGERRKKYLWRLICERLLDYSMDDKFENYWTVRGKELEPQAAAAFEAQHGVVLKDGAFITNGLEYRVRNGDDQDGPVLYSGDDAYGCSPDRVINKNECVEMKCPSPWEHLGYMLGGLGVDYKQQVQGQLLIGEFEVNHFWSFHPQMPPLHVATPRDEAFIERLSRELVYFTQELEHETARARAMGVFIPGREPPIDIPGVFPWTVADGPLQ